MIHTYRIPSKRGPGGLDRLQFFPQISQNLEKPVISSPAIEAYETILSDRQKWGGGTSIGGGPLLEEIRYPNSEPNVGGLIGEG